MRLQNTLAFLSSVLGLATSASAEEPVREIPKSVVTIQAGKVRYATVAYSADGKQLAIINDQKTIGIHNAATGKQVRSIATTRRQVWHRALLQVWRNESQVSGSQFSV